MKSKTERHALYSGLPVLATLWLLQSVPAAWAQVEVSALDSAAANEAILRSVADRIGKPVVMPVVSASAPDGTKWLRALVPDDVWAVQRPFAARVAFTCGDPATEAGDPACWDVSDPAPVADTIR